MKKGSRPTIAFISILVFGFALYFIMTAVQPYLKNIIFDYSTLDAGRTSDPLYRLIWMIGDFTEPFFHKTLLGGIGVFIGSIIAYVLDKKRSPYRGTPISYGNGKKWPWIFAAGFISLGIAVILFGGLHIDGDAWVPTFVPYVSVASAVILLYGANLRSLFTGAILGAIFTTPISLFVRYVICTPLELPGVIAAVTGMWVGGIFSFEIIRMLPWMKLEQPAVPEKTSEQIPEKMTIAEYKIFKPNRFFIRRMLADYSEPMYVGNEIAGACLIIGSMVTWILSPMQPYYGTGLFPELVLGQIITGAVAMYVYWEGWRDGDFFPTFVPVVSVLPTCILLFGGSMPVIIIAAVLGALACPAIANMVNRKIPNYWHPMIGFTFSMTVCSFAVGMIIRYVGMVLPLF